MAKLVVAFHGCDAHPPVALTHVEVHALTDGTAQSDRRRLREADDVRHATGSLTPAGQARPGHVVRRTDAEQESELDELGKQAMDRRTRLTEALRDRSQRCAVRRF